MSDKTPIEKFQEEYGRKALDCDGWNWRAQLPMWTWHGMDGFPNGDRIGKDPPFVLVEFEDPDLSASRLVAAGIDDIAIGLFYYRDWTSSGLQTDDSPVYWSGFWFQRVGDAVALTRLLDAEPKVRYAANWRADFERMKSGMNEKRGSMF